MFRKNVRIVILCLLGLLLASSAPVNKIPSHLSDLTTILGNESFNDETRSAVTFNTGFMRTYFSVWQRNNTDLVSTSIYGRLINFDGTLNGIVGPSLSPMTGINTDPDISYSEVGTSDMIDRYLVVYALNSPTSGSSSIRGMVLGNTGSTLPPPFASELIIAPAGTGDTYSNPAVAYSTTSHRWLVTWTHNHNGFQGIEARTVSVTDGAFGPVWELTGLLVSDPGYSDVAWCQPSDEFLVVWNKTATPFTDLDVYGRRIQMAAPAGLVGTDPFTIFGTFSNESKAAVSSITRTGGIGQYLVVAQEHEPSYSVVGQYINQNGSLEGTRLPISAGYGINPAVAGSTAGQEYLVAWPYSGGSLHARTVSPVRALGAEADMPLRDAWDTAIAAANTGDFLITATGWVQVGYLYDVWGFYGVTVTFCRY